MNKIEDFEKSIRAFDKHGVFEYTIHENMLAHILPNLERQAKWKNTIKK
ncbi:hypothetical protein RPA26_00875 [Staphylococcus haemolyticus]|nr:hypothetical protein [Staphylococcus haemolyticus]MDT4199094.1 hypothetical protein [Staphylococcus haemolyticus]MDT4206244.1 hypothetical protein [Staphylococcus haemolyticus]MDT4236599.1 hypothetical protein [Staphylococcus haemolyticus]MDT4246088.1 hypothetical protein [Staphylococcus haemolyticus]MDT4247824.1 hypothetical protein [Staphylococcus haemolyticus]